MARPVRTTALRTWSWWHQLGRWVRPVQGDTSLVGKPPSGGAAALESIHSRVRHVPLSKHGRQTTRDHGVLVLIMRKLIAWAFMYSLDGLLADEGTEY
jgi:hypothetical protein